MKNKTLVAREAGEMGRIIRLFMKRRSKGVKLTREEMSQLKSHMKQSAFFVTSLVILALPFGLLFFPIYTELVDRKRQRKN